MCCVNQWTRDIPMIGGLSTLVCSSSGAGNSLQVALDSSVFFIAATWYIKNGNDWDEIPGENGQTFTTTTSGEYMVLIITSEGAVSLESPLPCPAETNGYWQTPDGNNWETPTGDGWEWS